MRFLLPVALALAAATPAVADHHMQESAEPSDATIAALDAVLADARRDGDRARDGFRNPKETLLFFRVDPGMTVVDYMPSSGWYTRILAPYLGRQGKYIGLNPDPGSNEAFAKYVGGLRETFPAKTAGWNLNGAPIEAYNSNELTDAMNGTVDRVLIFREMHNLHRNNVLHNEMTRIHGLLKSGGMLGIVQHRARPDAPTAYVGGNRGYMREKDVIGLVEAHGFDLVSSAEINANPKDTADYDGGVWELPPVMRGKREELRSIGESDRMTLLFRKRD